MIIKAIRPPIPIITAIPPTTPPTIAPMFTLFLLGAAVEVWVEAEVVAEVEELVA
jgi:hypothetical protein